MHAVTGTYSLFTLSTLNGMLTSVTFQKNREKFENQCKSEYFPKLKNKTKQKQRTKVAWNNKRKCCAWDSGKATLLALWNTVLLLSLSPCKNTQDEVHKVRVRGLCMGMSAACLIYISIHTRRDSKLWWPYDFSGILKCESHFIPKAIEIEISWTVFHMILTC